MPHKILPWLAMASAMSAFTLQAQTMTDSELLLGSYTQGTSEGIYRFGFDSKTGMISPKPLQVIKTENPSWLTVSKDQRYLFVVNENGPGQGRQFLHRTQDLQGCADQPGRNQGRGADSLEPEQGRPLPVRGELRGES